MEGGLWSQKGQSAPVQHDIYLFLCGDKLQTKRVALLNFVFVCDKLKTVALILWGYSKESGAKLRVCVATSWC